MAAPKARKRANKRSDYRRNRPLLAYPGVLFVLLCAGVFLTGWTFKASGADIHVTAQVHGPAVTSPAVITTPKNGQHFDSIPVDVSGSCPANAAYVEIFRNNLMSGSALCDAGGNFQLSISLNSGRNDLTAHVFNVTDDEGPVSSVVTVYYDIPSAHPGASTPFVLTTAFLYKGYYVGHQVDWPLRLIGGTAPYALNVDWGDGKSDVISRQAAGDFTISHTYSAPGNYKHSYTIKINAADSGGQKTYLQFFIIVNSEAGSGLAGSIFSKPPPSLGNSLKWLWVAWPAYLVVSVMVMSYLLGEREELIILRRRGLLKR